MSCRVNFHDYLLVSEAHFLAQGFGPRVYRPSNFMEIEIEGVSAGICSDIPNKLFLPLLRSWRIYLTI